MSRAPLPALAALAAVALLAGCGGSGASTVATATTGPTAVRDKADALCETANRALLALPPFPFPTFDPLHPDPRRLRAVGRFYTGTGDPRPALRRAIAGRAALARPGAGLEQVVAADRQLIAAIEAQDAAALAGDVPAFVATVRRNERAGLAVERAADAYGLSCRLGGG